MTDRRGLNGTGGDPAGGIPRWLKLAGIVVAIVALVVITAMFIGGGGHTPRPH